MAVLLTLAALIVPATMAEASTDRASCHTRACERRAYLKTHPWTRRYYALPAAARVWLKRTGDCETRGTPYWRSYQVHGLFSGRYQFTAGTARAAGFRVLPHLAPPREQDVRAWRWRQGHGAGHWPNCAAW